MERLKYHTTYLVGPIDNISHADATGWRRDMTEFLQSLGVFVLDPTLKPIDGYAEDEEFFKKKARLKQDGKYDELYKIGKPIRSFDLNAVDMSSFIIVNLDLDVKMCGTWNELFIADQQRMPCLIMCSQGLDKIPDWLYFSLPSDFFFSNWDDLKNYITGIHDGSINELHNRWHLIDYDRILPPQLRPAKRISHGL